MRTLKTTVVVILFSLIFCEYPYAQNKTVDDELHEVYTLDSVFWKHYNSCNIDAMRSFFTDNIEFYHDKGGVIHGLDNFLMVSKKIYAVMTTSDCEEKL